MIGHFHTHTHYSILDSPMTVDKLIEKAYERKINAVAITEHGNISSAVEFFFKAKEAGVKPIIGCEIYLGEEYHLTVLVKDVIGYNNLCKLLYFANTEGFFRKPRVTFEKLYEHKEGLIVLSGCLNGPLSKLICENKIDEAFQGAVELKNHFGNDFYLEIMRAEPADPNRIEDNLVVAKQRRVNDYLLEFSKKLNIRTVATGDSHYADPEDYEIQDMLVAIGFGEKLTDKNRKFRYHVKGLYVKPAEEVKKIFKDIPEALDTHEEIINKCSFEFNKPKELKLPNPYPQDDPDKVLRQKCIEGLKKRLKGENKKEYYERLEKELSVISQKKFSSYFLIVEDFVREAKLQGIPVGPARGSAAGSIVSWALGITELDPIKHGLIFERFLNPEREKAPDIDIDFCKTRRDEIIKYVKRKYGEDKVCQIATFTTIGAKTAIRDVGRIYGISLNKVSFLSELIPFDVARRWTLKEAYNEIPEFRKAVETDDDYKKIYEKGQLIEGLIRQNGAHASGYLISDKSITEYMSVLKTHGELVTQFDMEWLEKIGLVKFDFLGLETLTVIQNTFELVKQRWGIELNYDNIPLDDKKVYRMLQAGDTFGVFQFESAGMRDMLIKLEPSEFSDLVAAVALYRPGPIQSGMVSDYIDRKKGIKPIAYPHPKLEQVLKETYGNFLYQEQIMFAANILANFSMAEADLLREAMGKKKPELMSALKERFISGCKNNGIDDQTASEIFDIMEKFSGYAFNKSHSAGYAFIAYITAYLKANYPVEYFSCLLSSEISNHEKLSKYLEQVVSSGIKLLPPSITKSKFEFTVEGNSIRFGLGGIKGFGEAGYKIVEQIRNTNSNFTFEEFLVQAKKLRMNKKMLELLVKAGAFDEIIKRQEAIVKLTGEIPSLFEKRSEEKDSKHIEEELLGIKLEEEYHLPEIVEIFPIVSRGITQVVALVKDIIKTDKGYLISALTPNKLKLNILTDSALEKNKFYIFTGKMQNGMYMIAKLVWDLYHNTYRVLLKISDEDSAKIAKELIEFQKDGDCGVVIDGDKTFLLKKKIKLTKEFKSKLSSYDIPFLIIPEKFQKSDL